MTEEYINAQSQILQLDAEIEALEAENAALEAEKKALEAADKIDEEKERELREKEEFLTRVEAALQKSAHIALAFNDAAKILVNFKGIVVLLIVTLFFSLLTYLAMFEWISSRCDDFYQTKIEVLNKQIKQLKEQASWATSKNGQEAQELDKMGLIKNFYNCKLQGFVIEKVKGKHYCFSNKSKQGWKMPD
ncbi:MAG: hypothetical protein J6P38_01250 [Acetobacter sp.]|nr:hypothetical protein [Acetobacter sp.]